MTGDQQKKRSLGGSVRDAFSQIPPPEIKRTLFRDFADMKLKEQHRGDVEDQDILTFSVLCNVEKGKLTGDSGRGARSTGSGDSGAEKTRLNRAVSG